MQKPERMIPGMQKALDKAVDSLRAELGANLYSCCLYGSTARGNAIEGVSDLNLLIILNESNVAAHQAISRAIGDQPKIDPFILARRGLARSFRAFAPKFGSIKRNYRVLHGADALADLEVDPQLEKFLCEQAIRNFRLRLVYSFVTRTRHKAYGTFVLRNAAALVARVSEALRLNGVSIPSDIDSRIPIFERGFKIDGSVLRDILALKREVRRLSEREVECLHEKLFPLLDTVLLWIETNWQ